MYSDINSSTWNSLDLKRSVSANNGEAVHTNIIPHSNTVRVIGIPLYTAAVSSHETIVNYHTVRNTLTLLQRSQIRDERNVPAELKQYVNAQDLQTDQHTAPVDILCARYNTSITSGLCNITTVEKHNRLTPPKKPSLLWLFCKQLFAGFNGALCIAFILGFISWKPIGQLNGATPSTTTLYISVLLVIVVFLCSSLSFYQELAANQIVASLSKIQTVDVHVLRNGEWIDIPSDELRLGDIVKVEMGMRVPADLRMVEVIDMKIDLSMLTGESEPISCTTQSTSSNYMESRNQAFLGADVLQGSGVGLVVNVGDNTVMGKIGTLTNGNKRLTGSLTAEINHFVLIVLSLGLTVASCSVLAWGVWVYQRYPTYLTVSGILQVVLGFAVAFVPEGLPISVTVTLGITARRMYRQNVLVKDLTTVETFNTISLIASDKTGTLTQNKMSVSRVVLGQSEQQQLSPIDKLYEHSSIPELQRTLLHYCVTLCNNASEEVGDDSTTDANNNLSTVIKGDASDVALYHYAAQQVHPCGLQQFRQQYPRKHALPFNSKNKYMITINRVIMNDKNINVVFVKGATEIVLSRCDRTIDTQTGEIRSMSSGDRAMWESKINYVGKAGERALGFACTMLDDTEYDSKYEYKVNDDGTTNYPSSGLIFLGIVSLIDPAKPEVAGALQKCREAKIRVAMVTGDHPTTAEAIAKNIGLISLPTVNRLQLSHDSESGNSILTCESNGRIIGVRSPDMLGGSLATDLTLRLQHQTSEMVWHPDGNKESMSLANIESALRQGNNHQEPDSCIKSDDIAIEMVSELRYIKPHEERINCALVVTGAQVSLFDKELWSWTLRHQEIVFARTTPEQKLRIVLEAQARGESVAVTGDGVNDAPALRAANLGIAMASGSEVAKEAGHMILLDNNFNSVVAGIELGRTMFDNLKKVCTYLLPAGTFSEALTVISQVFLGIPQPLGSFYMIIICVFTDVFLSTALMYEKAESDVMSRPPRNKKRDRLVDWRLIFFAWGNIGVIESVSAWCVFLWYMSQNGLPPHTLIFAWDKWPASDPTVQYNGIDGLTCNQLLGNGNALFFCTLVLCQFGNLLSVRTRRGSILQHNPFYGPNSNLRIPIGMVGAIVTILIVTRVQWFFNVFGAGVAELPFALAGLGFASFILMYDETRKYICRNYPKSIIARVAW